MSEVAPDEGSRSEESPPPFLSTWKNVYLLVMVELVVTVVAFWILTRWAS